LFSDSLKYYFDYFGKDNDIKFLKNASLRELTQFGELLCKNLNTIFQKRNKLYRQGKIYETESFYCLAFYYGEDKNEFDFISFNNADEFINNLAKKDHQNLRINKVITIHQNEYIYLIKPKALRYWLRSIALRDADEIIEDLLKAGY
ncbi:MAG: hypothetical protein K8R53_07065, partial [Bacteroidales bacterium]|nr:hypothetical protein [Bacteroidales bacterium]